jgi:two-component system response regulator TctD
VVEDNIQVADLLKLACLKFNARCDIATSGKLALAMCAATRFDAIILDLGLPDIDGMQVLTKLRQLNCNTPVLILTARGSLQDKIDGLDAGADDYLAKPFATEELLARLRALLRRPEHFTGNQLCHGNMVLDLKTAHLAVAGKRVELGKTEFSILSYLLRNTGITVSKDAIIDSLFGFDDEISENAVQVAVHRLRKKLLHFNASFNVKTLRGIGYVLQHET